MFFLHLSSLFSPDRAFFDFDMTDTVVQSTKLRNGLTILTERMQGLRSASLGIWVRRGSRHEPRALNGICHFIEHAVFKGTGRRSALEIAVESDLFWSLQTTL
jgi:predicted Zn-dependent peptidase